MRTWDYEITRQLAFLFINNRNLRNNEKSSIIKEKKNLLSDELYKYKLLLR